MSTIAAPWQLSPRELHGIAAKALGRRFLPSVGKSSDSGSSSEAQQPPDNNGQDKSTLGNIAQGGQVESQIDEEQQSEPKSNDEELPEREPGCDDEPEQPEMFDTADAASEDAHALAEEYAQTWNDFIDVGMPPSEHEIAEADAELERSPWRLQQNESGQWAVVQAQQQQQVQQYSRDDVLRQRIVHAAAMTDRKPSKEQMRAGNYKKGRVGIHGMTFVIENPKGSTRSGVSKGGKSWSVTMKDHYGYISRTESEADGDAVDVFLGPHPESEIVFVVDQSAPGGRFDEHKVMMGFLSESEAKDAYFANYSKGWDGFRSITPMTIGTFKEWLKNGDTGIPAEGQAKLRFSREGFVLQFAAMRAPYGSGTPGSGSRFNVQGGKPEGYLKGQFIPGNVIDSLKKSAASGNAAAQQQVSQLEQAHAGHEATRQKGIEVRGQRDISQLKGKLAAHAGGRPLDARAQQQAVRSFRQLRSVHGDLILHRLDEKTEEIQGRLNRANKLIQKTPEKLADGQQNPRYATLVTRQQRLQADLARFNHIHQLAEAQPKTQPQEKPSSTAPPQGAVEETEAQPAGKSTAPPQGAVEKPAMPEGVTEPKSEQPAGPREAPTPELAAELAKLGAFRFAEDGTLKARMDKDLPPEAKANLRSFAKTLYDDDAMGYLDRAKMFAERQAGWLKKSEQPNSETNPPAMERVQASLASNANLSPEQRQYYGKSAEGVISKMSTKMLERFQANTKDIRFAASPEDLKAKLIDDYKGTQFEQQAQAFYGNKNEICGVYQNDKKSITIDGDPAKPTPHPTANRLETAEQVYAHEFTHAIDGPNYEISSTPEWQEAWRAELRDVPGDEYAYPLSIYASQKPSEGFAEFGRAILQKEADAASLKERFPKSFAVWEKHGLVEPPAGSPSGEMQKLPEVFDQYIQLPNGHADARSKALSEQLAAKQLQGEKDDATKPESGSAGTGGGVEPGTTEPATTGTAGGRTEPGTATTVAPGAKPEPSETKQPEKKEPAASTETKATAPETKPTEPEPTKSAAEHPLLDHLSAKNPRSLKKIAERAGIDKAEAAKQIKQLVKDGRVTVESDDDGDRYRLASARRQSAAPAKEPPAAKPIVQPSAERRTPPPKMPEPKQSKAEPPATPQPQPKAELSPAEQKRAENKAALAKFREIGNKLFAGKTNPKGPSRSSFGKLEMNPAKIRKEAEMDTLSPDQLDAYERLAKQYENQGKAEEAQKYKGKADELREWLVEHNRIGPEPSFNPGEHENKKPSSEGLNRLADTIAGKKHQPEPERPIVMQALSPEARQVVEEEQKMEDEKSRSRGRPAKNKILKAAQQVSQMKSQLASKNPELDETPEPDEDNPRPEPITMRQRLQKDVSEIEKAIATRDLKALKRLKFQRQQMEMVSRFMRLAEAKPENAAWLMRSARLVFARN